MFFFKWELSIRPSPKEGGLFSFVLVLILVLVLFHVTISPIRSSTICFMAICVIAIY